MHKYVSYLYTQRFAAMIKVSSCWGFVIVKISLQSFLPMLGSSVRYKAKVLLSPSTAVLALRPRCRLFVATRRSSTSVLFGIWFDHIPDMTFRKYPFLQPLLRRRFHIFCWIDCLDYLSSDCVIPLHFRTHLHISARQWLAGKTLRFLSSPLRLALNMISWHLSIVLLNVIFCCSWRFHPSYHVIRSKFSRVIPGQSLSGASPCRSMPSVLSRPFVLWHVIVLYLHRVGNWSKSKGNILLQIV